MPDADWLLADACEIASLGRGRPRECDVVVAATGDDKVNLVVSLLAKTEYGVPRTVARVNNPKNEWMFDEAWGVDVAVSTPRLMTALVEEAVSVGDLVRIFTFQQGQRQHGRAHAARRLAAGRHPRRRRRVARRHRAGRHHPRGAADRRRAATTRSRRTTSCCSSRCRRARRPCQDAAHALRHGLTSARPARRGRAARPGQRHAPQHEPGHPDGQGEQRQAHHEPWRCRAGTAGRRVRAGPGRPGAARTAPTQSQVTRW